MTIDLKQVEHIALLARLSLTEDEKKTLSSQLSGVLEYMAKLDELDTTDTEPTSHVLDLVNAMREDIPKPSLKADEALSNAPERSGDFYRVPRIIE